MRRGTHKTQRGCSLDIDGETESKKISGSRKSGHVRRQDAAKNAKTENNKKYMTENFDMYTDLYTSSSQH